MATHVTRIARDRLSREAREQDKGAFLGDAAAGGFQPTVAVQVRIETADERVAHLLGVASGDEILVRDRVMSADGRVVQLATSRLPREITRGTSIEDDDTGPGGMYARLEEAGYRLDHFDEVITARMPTAAEQGRLRLPNDVPVIVVTRVAHSAARPVEVNDMVLAADKYELHYRLPAE